MRTIVGEKTHENRSEYPFVLEEYTAYRIFNLISNFGYRVRLLRIRYDDEEATDTEKLLQKFNDDCIGPR